MLFESKTDASIFSKITDETDLGKLWKELLREIDSSYNKKVFKMLVDIGSTEDIATKPEDFKSLLPALIINLKRVYYKICANEYFTKLLDTGHYEGNEGRIRAKEIVENWLFDMFEKYDQFFNAGRGIPIRYRPDINSKEPFVYMVDLSRKEVNIGSNIAKISFKTGQGNKNYMPTHFGTDWIDLSAAIQLKYLGDICKSDIESMFKAFSKNLHKDPTVKLIKDGFWDNIPFFADRTISEIFNDPNNNIASLLLGEHGLVFKLSGYLANFIGLENQMTWTDGLLQRLVMLYDINNLFQSNIATEQVFVKIVKHGNEEIIHKLQDFPIIREYGGGSNTDNLYAGPKMLIDMSLLENWKIDNGQDIQLYFQHGFMQQKENIIFWKDPSTGQFVYKTYTDFKNSLSTDDELRLKIRRNIPGGTSANGDVAILDTRLNFIEIDITNGNGVGAIFDDTKHMYLDFAYYDNRAGHNEYRVGSFSDIKDSNGDIITGIAGATSFHPKMLDVDSGRIIALVLCDQKGDPIKFPRIKEGGDPNNPAYDYIYWDLRHSLSSNFPVEQYDGRISSINIDEFNSLLTDSGRTKNVKDIALILRDKFFNPNIEVDDVIRLISDEALNFEKFIRTHEVEVLTIVDGINEEPAVQPIRTTLSRAIQHLKNQIALFEKSTDFIEREYMLLPHQIESIKESICKYLNYIGKTDINGEAITYSNAAQVLSKIKGYYEAQQTRPLLFQGMIKEYDTEHNLIDRIGELPMYLLNSIFMGRNGDLGDLSFEMSEWIQNYHFGEGKLSPYGYGKTVFEEGDSFFEPGNMQNEGSIRREPIQWHIDKSEIIFGDKNIAEKLIKNNKGDMGPSQIYSFVERISDVIRSFKEHNDKAYELRIREEWEKWVLQNPILKQDFETCHDQNLWSTSMRKFGERLDLIFNSGGTHRISILESRYGASPKTRGLKMVWINTPPEGSHLYFQGTRARESFTKGYTYLIEGKDSVIGRYGKTLTVSNIDLVRRLRNELKFGDSKNDFSFLRTLMTETGKNAYLDESKEIIQILEWILSDYETYAQPKYGSPALIFLDALINTKKYRDDLDSLAKRLGAISLMLEKIAGEHKWDGRGKYMFDHLSMLELGGAEITNKPPTITSNILLFNTELDMNTKQMIAKHFGYSTGKNREIKGRGNIAYVSAFSLLNPQKASNFLNNLLVTLLITNEDYVSFRGLNKKKQSVEWFGKNGNKHWEFNLNFLYKWLCPEYSSYKTWYEETA